MEGSRSKVKGRLYACLIDVYVDILRVCEEVSFILLLLSL